MRRLLVCLVVLCSIAPSLAAFAAKGRNYLTPQGDVSRLSLGGIDLSAIDLRGMRAVRTNFRKADFHGADLREVILRGADLRGADLRGTDLRGANLRRAKLRGADLRGADLRTRYRFIRRTAFVGARFDELTQLPDHWGRTHEQRIQTAMLEGMVFEPTVASLDHALKLLDGPTAECPQRIETPPSWTRGDRDIPRAGYILPKVRLEGTWRGEIHDRSGKMVVRRISGSRYLGRFVDEYTGEIFTMTIWLEPAGDKPGFTNRAFVQWRSSFRDIGRGWLLFTKEQDAITGGMGFFGATAGIDVTFLR